jgi:hypothetical protein
VDAASKSSIGAGPVVAVVEKRRRVELRILDVGFGLPESVLRRAFAAPGEPPAGLESLGRLVTAVEDCHGEAELSGEPGWGATILLRFVRARTRTALPPADPGTLIEISSRTRRS